MLAGLRGNEKMAVRDSLRERGVIGEGASEDATTPETP